MGGTLALLRRGRADAGVLTVLVLLVAVTAGLVGAVPGLLDRLARASLVAAVDEARVDTVGLAATAVRSVDTSDADATAAALSATAADLRALVPAPVDAIIGEATTVIDTVRYDLDPLPGAPPDALERKLTLRVQSGVEDELLVVEGALPDGVTDTFALGEDTLSIHQFAATADVAEGLRMAVGDRRLATPDATGPLLARLPLRPTAPVVVELSGIVELRPVVDPVWFGDPRLHRASQFDTNTSTTVFGFGIVPLDAVAELPGGTGGQVASVGVRWGLDRAALLEVDPRPVRDGALALRTSAPLQLEEPRWTTGLDRVLDAEDGRRSAAVEVLGIAAVGWLGVALALLVVVAGLLTRRRRAATTLVRGRGASRVQLFAATLFESAVIAGLGVTLASAALAATAPSAIGAVIVAAVGGVCLVVLVVAAVRDLRRPLGALLAERRLDVRGSSHHVLDGLVVVLAVVATLALRRRGVQVDGTTDALVVAAPLLLVAAVAVLAARFVPVALRSLAAVGRRSRRLAVPLGLTRATRDNASAALVVLLVLGLGVGGIALAVRGTLRDGQKRAAQETVGADVRVDAAPLASLDPDWQPTDPAADVAELTLLDGSLVTDIGAQRIDVLLVDPSELASVAGDGLPELAWDGISATPVVLSSSLRPAGAPEVGDTASVLLGLERVAARVVALDPRVLGRDEERDGAFVVLDRAAAVAATGQDPGVTSRLVSTDRPDEVVASALASDADAEVLVRREVEARLRDAPLARGVSLGFSAAAVAVAVATGAAVVLALAAAAPGRRRQSAVLGALGTPTWAVRLAVLAEVLPTAGLAAITGASVATFVAFVVGNRLDLSPFTGTVDATGLAPPSLVAVTTAVVGATLLSAVAVLVTIGRVDPGGLLREGDG